jgi:hypothetical protein
MRVQSMAIPKMKFSSWIHSKLLNTHHRSSLKSLKLFVTVKFED